MIHLRLFAFLVGLGLLFQAIPYIRWVKFQQAWWWFLIMSPLVLVLAGWHLGKWMQQR